jgi:hypothetical protein
MRAGHHVIGLCSAKRDGTILAAAERLREVAR